MTEGTITAAERFATIASVEDREYLAKLADDIATVALSQRLDAYLGGYVAGRRSAFAEARKRQSGTSPA